MNSNELEEAIRPGEPPRGLPDSTCRNSASAAQYQAGSPRRSDRIQGISRLPALTVSKHRTELIRRPYEIRKSPRLQGSVLSARQQATEAKLVEDQRRRVAQRRETQLMQDLGEMPLTSNTIRAGVSEETDASSGCRNPWETLDPEPDFGEGLSNIQRQDRMILHRKWIIKWFEENNELGSARLHHPALERLIRHRKEMESDPDNYLPEEEFLSKTRVAERLQTLRRALDTSKCEDEAVNIRAAIAGYESGQIIYSPNFTLIYAGQIVDTCSSYETFVEDRDERLDHYFDLHGSGWLWHEPPLAEQQIVFGKKGLCLTQAPSRLYPGFGLYPIFMRFVVDESKVRRSGVRIAGQSSSHSAKGTAVSNDSRLGSVRFSTLKVVLDSGATFPILHIEDLQDLNINLTDFPAQGVLGVSTVGSHVELRCYELHVGIGEKLRPATYMEHHDEILGYPHEEGIMGGLLPVLGAAGGDKRWLGRLSGIIPFKACYMSSVPTTGKLWLGENRREVLGAHRMPPYQRYGTHDIFVPGYPEELEAKSKELRTPDAMVFLHQVGDAARGEEFIDSEMPDEPGVTTWTEKTGQKVTRQAEFGPALGSTRARRKQDGTPWRDYWHDHLPAKW